ncbi:MAG: four helix bundle protein [Bacteroidaceae bacterium]|nr:four helix bundle protein [Bacteroidaceae bacterium]
MYNFERLEVWHVARELVTKVYHLLSKFPVEERFALCDQIRRAAISVPSNIVEGDSRISPKEQMHFVEIAYGSLMELYCQLVIAVDLGYLQKEWSEVIEANRLIDQTARMLSGLRKSLENKTIAK